VWAVLDVAEELGCHCVITLGGLKREAKVAVPKLYCAASDAEFLGEALSLGAKRIKGRIFGVAGLLVGLCKLRGMKGLCLLAETPGFYPDATAAREVLKAVCKMLCLKVDLARLDLATEATRKILESFGLVADPTEKRTDEESRFRWLI